MPKMKFVNVGRVKVENRLLGLEDPEGVSYIPANHEIEVSDEALAEIQKRWPSLTRKVCKDNDARVAALKRDRNADLSKFEYEEVTTPRVEVIGGSAKKPATRTAGNGAK